MSTSPAAGRDVFDPTKPAHAMALSKLDTAEIMWFVSVRPDGRPHAVPVWFYPRDGRLLVFSEPDSAKVRHVRSGSAVQVHLETGAFGNEVVVLDTAAEVSERPAADWLLEFRDGYVAKYAKAIEDYGMGLDDIAARFSTVLVLTPTHLTAW
jgi:PPOX class probable F420-dependent enzyme